MLKIIILLSILLAGCTTIDKHVEGWPVLKVTAHETSLWDIQKRCWSSLPIQYKLLGSVVAACAEYNLDAGTCDIYHTSFASDSVMEHERSHCAGGDHDGVQQHFYNVWKRGA